MNILDENIISDQPLLLRNWRIPIRHIGYNIGRRGLQDEEILPFLLRQPRPRFSLVMEIFTTVDCVILGIVLSTLQSRKKKRRFLSVVSYATQHLILKRSG